MDMSSPSLPRKPLGSLDGPSRTIRVEPVQAPVTAPPPQEPAPAREPERPPAPKPERVPAR
jgi:hypothetical protein